MTEPNRQPRRPLADTPNLVANGPYEDTAWWIATTNTPPQCVAPGGVVLMDRNGRSIDDRAAEAADHARTVLARYHERINGECADLPPEPGRLTRRR